MKTILFIVLFITTSAVSGAYNMPDFVKRNTQNKPNGGDDQVTNSTLAVDGKVLTITPLTITRT